MSIEKIERVREVMSWLDGWDSNRSAASFKGFQSITLGDIRALLDELSRLRKALKPFAKEAEAWIGFDEIEPLTEGWQNGPSTHLNVGHLRAAARALSEREGQAE